MQVDALLSAAHRLLLHLLSMLQHVVEEQTPAPPSSKSKSSKLMSLFLSHLTQGPSQSPI